MFSCLIVPEKKIVLWIVVEEAKVGGFHGKREGFTALSECSFRTFALGDVKSRHGKADDAPDRIPAGLDDHLVVIDVVAAPYCEITLETYAAPKDAEFDLL